MTKPILIVGEAPGARLSGLTRSRIDALAGRPWEEWADWTNLLEEWPGPARGRGSAWNTRAAATRVKEIPFADYDLVILLGRRVAQAVLPGGAGIPWFRFVDRNETRFIVFPHTSGTSAFWNDPEKVERAKGFLTDLVASLDDATRYDDVRKFPATGTEQDNPERTEHKPAMSNTSNSTRVTGREAVIAAFRAAGKPLTAKEAAALVIAAKVVPDLTAVGSTPAEYRLYAPVYREAAAGRFYKRVGSTSPAKFTVRANAPESDPTLVAVLKKTIAKSRAGAAVATKKARSSSRSRAAA